jgi:ferredoxin
MMKTPKTRWKRITLTTMFFGASAIVVAAGCASSPAGSDPASIDASTSTDASSSTDSSARLDAEGTDSSVGDGASDDARATDASQLDARADACPGSEVICGSSCVSTMTNPSHCGACGKACPTGATCVSGGCGAHRYWRFLENAVTAAHTPRSAEVRWFDRSGSLRTPTSYVSSFDVSSALPFDGLTNVLDEGWIVSFGGANGSMVADFGIAGASMGKFQVWSSYTGGQRGADWDIAWADDLSTWHSVGTLHYLTTAGGAAEAANGFGGYYQLTWPEALNH